jgi:signal peptidase I
MGNIKVSDQDDNNNSPVIDIGLVKTILESGHSIELPATGYSMFPTLRPGYRLVVKPATKGETPKIGSVVVYKDNGSLVMHRLIEIIDDDPNNILFITRGDSMLEPDKPWPLQQMMGVAVSYRGVKKEHSVKTFVPGVWRYGYNRRLLWKYNKLMRLYDKIKA